MAKTKKFIDEITGLPCDSNEEAWFSWYLQELKEAGYIKDFRRAQSYQLRTKLMINDETNDKAVTLLKAHKFTPDFEFEWDESAHKIFYNVSSIYTRGIPFIIRKGIDYSIVDVKPDIDRGRDKNNTIYKFEINAGWLMQKEGEYVQMIQCKELFYRTFTPKRFLYQDKNKSKLRRISFDTRYLDEYVKARKRLNSNE